MFLASFIGDLELIQRLLALGARIKSTCDRFGSVLLAALEGDHIQAVQLFLERGIDVNFVTTKHGSALHCACAKPASVAVKMLLMHGTDVNASNSPHGRPFTAALSSRNLAGLPFGKHGDEVRKIAQLLVECDTFRVQEQDMCAALVHWQAEHYVNLLLKNDTSYKVSEWALMTAVMNADDQKTDALKTLLQRDGGLGATERMISLTLGEEPKCAERLTQTSSSVSRHFRNGF